MAQEPLTPAGVQQKQDDLYALSNNQLQAEVDLIRADFRSWMKDNFILNSSQETYLDNMGDEFIEHASVRTGIATINRLPIYLIVPTPGGVSKYIRTQDTMVTLWNQTAGLTATGDLTFEIIYQ